MQASLSKRWKWWGAISVVVLCLSTGCLAWLAGDQILAWYYVRGLCRSGDADRDTWVRKVLQLDSTAAPALLRCFRREEAQPCAQAFRCLIQLAKRWGANEPRTAMLVFQLAEEFPSFSGCGQYTALEVNKAVLQLSLKEPLLDPLARGIAACLTQVACVSDARIHARSLALAELMVERTATVEVIQACRDLTHFCLNKGNAEIRSQAARLAAHPNIALHEPLLALLRDPSPEVRRAALLAIGPVPEAIATDDLLPWLHDADADVRRLCEGCLRGRGLQEDHIKIGRLITDERVAVRLQVLDYVQDNSELEPGVWLRRLSHDQAPAVRAAMLRVASEQTSVDLSDRIEQMSSDDASATVRQMARYYLSSKKSD